MITPTKNDLIKKIVIRSIAQIGLPQKPWTSRDFSRGISYAGNVSHLAASAACAAFGTTNRDRQTSSSTF
jgi:hypothetical protein